MDDVIENADVESSDDELTVSGPVVQGSKQNRPSALSLEWHAKLGHPGRDLFERTKKTLGLKNVFHVPMSHCDTCLFGKAKRSIPKVLQNLDPVSRPLEVLHADLCGPFHHPVGHDNSLYFLTIVDRFSRFVYAVPIRYKSDGGDELKKFIAESVRRFGLSVMPREVRSDNGTEFVNDNLEN